MLGLFDSSGFGSAVYFAAHDPRHIVKTCTVGSGSMQCTMLALDATKKLVSYKAI